MSSIFGGPDLDHERLSSLAFCHGMVPMPQLRKMSVDVPS